MKPLAILPEAIDAFCQALDAQEVLTNIESDGANSL